MRFAHRHNNAPIVTALVAPGLAAALALAGCSSSAAPGRDISRAARHSASPTTEHSTGVPQAPEKAHPCHESSSRLIGHISLSSTAGLLLIAGEWPGVSNPEAERFAQNVSQALLGREAGRLGYLVFEVSDKEDSSGLVSEALPAAVVAAVGESALARGSNETVSDPKLPPGATIITAFSTATGNCTNNTSSANISTNNPGPG